MTLTWCLANHTQGGGDRWGGYAQCEGSVPPELVAEIRKSFPSGKQWARGVSGNAGVDTGTNAYVGTGMYGCGCGCSCGSAPHALLPGPAGHSALSASGLGFVTLFLLGQLRTFALPAPTSSQPTGSASGTMLANGQAGTPSPSPTSGGRRRRLGRGWQLLIALLPSFGAVAVGVTRVMDYWHHPTDVLTGLLIGFGTAYGVYRTYYPSLSHPRCDVPLHVLEAAHARAAAAAAAAGSTWREGGGGGGGGSVGVTYGVEEGGAAAAVGRAAGVREGWMQQQAQQQHLELGVGDGARPLRQPLLVP